MSSATTSWPERLLGELLDIDRRTIVPGAFPNEEFVHYSIPAWDENRAPALEPGASIGSTKLSITQPTLLVSKLNPRIPRVVHVRNPAGLRHCASTEFIPYIARDDKASLEFFQWFLQSSLFQRRLERIATGSTNSHTRARPSETLGWTVPCPTPEDQQRIGAVLDTVDEAIAKTEGVIAKLKQVRAGLLPNILTRGIDEHGQLRDAIDHPEQFQDSPLGRIPRDWRVCGVLDLGSFDRQAILTGPFGAQLGQGDFVADGIPVLRIGNVQSGYIDWSDVQYVAHTKAIELKRFSVLPGDLLFARQGATTGRNALADEKAAGALINYHIIRVAVDRDLCEPVFLHAIFNSEPTLRQVNRDKGRGTREGINTEQISSLRFALPPIEEQRRAVAVLANHDANEHCETALLAKLYQLKSGLMADLLTGRVRVPESVSAVENQP